MNSLILKLTKGADHLNVGLLTVDIDVAASRLMIIDRTTGLVMRYMEVPPSKTFQTVFNYEYALTNKIIVGIIDMNGVYALQKIDAIKLEPAVLGELDIW
ncbi:hypothetical protein [Shewanella glacialimarina]|uniref:hypothetical protein n=1 Tax=Shewanella glacialimarina TaxID=2590884 RepID=UPI001CF875EB|nr:hypothetical protein [Shewanella glacialimarina]UCX04992.1 hypothetical protein FJ709_11080 [Shewanella glacialimarina]